MVTLYGYTILANLALLAIVIALFIFTASIYRAALELSTKEEEEALNIRKGLITRRRQEVTQKLKEVDDATFVKESRAELNKLDTEIDTIDQSILKVRNKGKALKARNMIYIPASFLLMSIITSGIAIATYGILPTIMWVVSLASMATGVCFMYRNLSTVEFFSKVIDLSTLMEQALYRHRMKSTPILEIELPDFQFEIQRGKTKEIIYFVYLKQGLIAKNTRVRFSGTDELEFPDKKIKQIGIDYNNMINPKEFWQEFQDVNPKVYKKETFKVKAPDKPGEYTMAYWLHCEEYTGEEVTFKIKVI